MWLVDAAHDCTDGIGGMEAGVQLLHYRSADGQKYMVQILGRDTCTMKERRPQC